MELSISNKLNKAEKLLEISKQVRAFWDDEIGICGNLANLSSLLHYSMGWFWTGFYLVKGKQLVLGPFQGPTACTRIGYGKGVCGSAWKENKSILVPDVEKFPGHIACSSLSVSEIVIPIRNSAQEIIGVLDVDSDRYDILDETDSKGLEEIINQLEDKF